MLLKKILIGYSSIPKIFGSFAFLCIAFALLIIAFTPLAQGYEISIYDAFPFTFWFAIIIAIFFGMIILIHQALIEKKSYWWILGLFIVIICISFLILIHTLRGYPLSDPSDLNHHHRFTQDILENGFISNSNFYPIMHIFTAQSMSITKLSEKTVVDLFTIVLMGLYIIGMYLLSKSITKSTKQSLFVTAFASIPLFQHPLIYYHPSGGSILLLPLFLYFTSSLFSYKIDRFICILIIGFFITVFHPVTSFYLIIILIFIFLGITVYNRFPTYKIYPVFKKMKKRYAHLAFIISLIFFVWYSSFSIFQTSIMSIANLFLYGLGISSAVAHLQLLGKVNFTLIQTLEFFFNRYGVILILFFIALFFLLLILKQIFSKKEKINYLMFLYGTVFFCTALTSLIMFFGPFENDPLRILRLPIILCLLFVGISYYNFLLNSSKVNKRRNARGFFVTFLLVILCISTSFSVFNFYRSPRVVSANQQTTYMELEVTGWLIENQEHQLNTLSTYAYLNRYQQYFLSQEEIKSKQGIIVIEEIPPHFGYNISNKNTLTDSLQNNKGYMVLCKLDILFPYTLPENVRENIFYQHSTEDLIRLNSDNIVNKIYHNGEVETWFIRN